MNIDAGKNHARRVYLFYSSASARLSETKQNKMNAKRSSYCTFALTVTFSGPFCFGAVLAGGVLTVDPLRLVDKKSASAAVHMQCSDIA